MSELDHVIPPEIHNDEFYYLIVELASREKLRHVLEIGSSSGLGSTYAFVAGLSQNPHHPQLHCLEISAPRFAQLKEHYQGRPFVHCHNVSSVGLAEFPSKEQVAEFYRNETTGLNNYPLEQVLGWLQQDIDYLNTWKVPENGIELIKQQIGGPCFDMVLIDGSEFTGEAELQHVYGAKWILLDDVNGFKNFRSYQRLKKDARYELYRENWQVRNGYAVFKRVDARPSATEPLPVHFFTIVLNGMPFIQHHIEVFQQLDFRWHWHIIEGVANLSHCTAWSVPNGGRVSEELHRAGLSTDGTSEYLDELARRFPDRISIYRKPGGQFWDGKVEMVNAPLPEIREAGLLWEIDADELWLPEQIRTARQLFLDDPHKTAAYYFCRFFVGPELVTTSRETYGNNSSSEWLRTWRFTPGDRFQSHEPPRLFTRGANGCWTDVAAIDPLRHPATEAAGLVFQHFAYVMESQVRFKEIYYGYRGAVQAWRRLQNVQQYPIPLREYLPWVQDATTAGHINSLGIVPLAAVNGHGEWTLRCASPQSPRPASAAPAPAWSAPSPHPGKHPLIVIDGVFFDMYETGIARVWEALFREWAKSEFAQHLLLLARQGKHPHIPGIHCRTIPRYDIRRWQEDRAMLQAICDQEQADLFTSTYYTTVERTPSVMMVHDMIPEATGVNLDADPQWADKHRAIREACAFFCVSENTRKDLHRFFPQLDPDCSVVISHGIDTERFKRAPAPEVIDFCNRYSLTKPYFLLVGGRTNYKNAQLFFEAMSKLPSQHGFQVFVTGGFFHEADLRDLRTGCEVVSAKISDRELLAAYSGAVAMVYPSRYEGFGLPVLEAMACGCPVIATPYSAISEAAGDAAIYVTNAAELAGALCDIQKPEVQGRLVAAGYHRVQRFSWPESAARVQAFFETVCRMLKPQEARHGAAELNSLSSRSAA